MNCVKESLQEEVTAHRSNNKDNENIYITFVTNFLHMFNYGVVENSLQCNECRKIFTSTENFEVLNLGFDETHNNKDKGRHRCSLGEMLEFYSRDNDSIVERECQACKQTRNMTQQNRIVTYPQILCIHLSRGTHDHYDKIIAPVDFPVENFQPEKYFRKVDEQDDATTYDLIASVNHVFTNKRSSGHYLAVCRRDVSENWYQYDDENVEKVQFTKCNKRKTTVKIAYQRNATMLFYRKRSNQPSLNSLSEMSNNEFDDDNESRFSQNEDNDEGNNDKVDDFNVDEEVKHGENNSSHDDSEVERIGTNDNSNQTTIEEVCTSVVCAQIKFYYAFHLQFYSTFSNRNFIPFIQETKASPICAWGMERGITQRSGNPFGEHCSTHTYTQLTCAHDGCNAKVHRWCQWGWLRIARLDCDNRSPVYCPTHNRQRGDYITWYYELKGRPIPESLDLTTSESVGEPYTLPENNSVARICGGDSMATLHSTAENTTCTYTTTLSSTAENSSISDQVNATNVEPKEAVNCTICQNSIDLDNRNSSMQLQCSHSFHRNCIETWWKTKVRH